jgi:hypothetical protein
MDGMARFARGGSPYAARGSILGHERGALVRCSGRERYRETGQGAILGGTRLPIRTWGRSDALRQGSTLRPRPTSSPSIGRSVLRLRCSTAAQPPPFQEQDLARTRTEPSMPWRSPGSLERSARRGPARRRRDRSAQGAGPPSRPPQAKNFDDRPREPSSVRDPSRCARYGRPRLAAG